jgi:hypothetical protein
VKTPEGKIKDAVKAFLKERKVQSLTSPMSDAVGFYWMPVPSGMGNPSLDFVICYRGHFIAFETKAFGGKPMPRQRMLMDMVRQGGGISDHADSIESAVGYLKATFDYLDNYK